MCESSEPGPTIPRWASRSPHVHPCTPATLPESPEPKIHVRAYIQICIDSKISVVPVSCIVIKIDALHEELTVGRVVEILRHLLELVFIEVHFRLCCIPLD